jgi:hypothetical protein
MRPRKRRTGLGRSPSRRGGGARPNGRRSGHLTAAMMRVLAERDADLLARVLMARAARGDVRAIKLVFEALAGKPA